ncbi:MAG TPA: hypothetical protein VGO11_19425 [Chthoniobacteraceae bacterium]|nr:hypothetical protein [Chthoniobacteraceae bacterium]
MREDARKGKHDEARDLIIRLITGAPISSADNNWTVEPTVDSNLLSLFGQLLGRAGEVPPEPLTSEGHNLLVLPVGNLRTVIASNAGGQKVSASNVGDLVRAAYPRVYEDGSTCYWYAMARTADLLRERSPQGYYLFVVSDESDDPDYLEFGAHDHSKGDYLNYVKNLRNQYPPDALKATIEKHFEKQPQSVGDKWSGLNGYRPRDDFPMTLIAHIFQKNQDRHDEHKIRLSWYAMGVKSIEPIRDPGPGTGGEKLVRPEFPSKIALLGGLEGSATKPKPFKYANPLIIWQAPFGEATGLSGAKFGVQPRSSSGSKWAPVAGSIVSPRVAGPKTALLDLEEAGSSDYQVAPKDEAGQGITPKPFKIEVPPRYEWLLPLLAVLSALCALGIFIWTWFSFSPKAPRSGKAPVR